LRHSLKVTACQCLIAYYCQQLFSTGRVFGLKIQWFMLEMLSGQAFNSEGSLLQKLDSNTLNHLYRFELPELYVGPWSHTDLFRSGHITAVSLLNCS
jgi:hypothetical protein